MDNQWQQTVTPELREATVAAAHDEYYSRLAAIFPRLQGRGNGVHGHKWYNDFVKIAALCLDQGVDVREFVARAIQVMLPDATGIMPRNLLKFDVRTKVLAELAKADIPQPEAEWRSQEKELAYMLEQASRMYPAALDALILASTPFSSWFRVLSQQPFNEELFAAYGVEAWKELRDNKAMRVYLRHKTPENLKQLEQRVALFEESLRAP